MLVKNACWWKTCMLVKNLHQHSPPKFHDVGEIVCWRKKICSFKIICMLVNYVGENFDVCWWKVFLMTKYVCWWKMLVKNVCWWKIYVGEIISLKYVANFMLVKTIRTKYLIFNKDWVVKYTIMTSKVYDHLKCTILFRYTVMTESI